MKSNPTSKKQPMNLRNKDVMKLIQQEVESHYHSNLVNYIKMNGYKFHLEGTSIHLAKQFGFCYGVERAIDLTYAARKVFSDARIFLLGEIIHNPDVNAQMLDLGILKLAVSDLYQVTADDIVILPAFGVEINILDQLKQSGCQIVDTTCGDVMSVWKRVKQNTNEAVTSLIHGKVNHEETRATASYAFQEGKGQYLIIKDIHQAENVADYLLGNLDEQKLMNIFNGAYSKGFDPAIHLKKIGIANQTTMLREETETIQQILKQAIQKRDGNTNNFRIFDTICGATQERQDALKLLIEDSPQLLFVIGGYNSSNTTHLAEIGKKNRINTYFIRHSECLDSKSMIHHFNWERKEEIYTPIDWKINETISIGITAGASCPNHLIEGVIWRILELRNHDVKTAQLNIPNLNIEISN